MAQVLLDSRLSYESLEPLNDFQAFLVPKLSRKIPNFSGICRVIFWDFLNEFAVFGYNFGTRNTRKSIKGFKDSHYSLETKIF